MIAFKVHPTVRIPGERTLRSITAQHYWCVYVFDGPEEMLAAVHAAGGNPPDTRPASRRRTSAEGGILGELYTHSNGPGALSLFWVARVSVRMAMDTLELQALADGDPCEKLLDLIGPMGEANGERLGILTGHIASQILEQCFASNLNLPATHGPSPAPN